MTWKDYFDNKEELATGFCLQLPLWAIVYEWTLAVMVVCGLLWRWGGCKGGWKPARWALVPLVVCGSAVACGVGWAILLAAPFMVKLAPSYGKTSWLFKLLKNDFLVRLLCFGWYWTAFALGYALSILK